MTTPYVSGTVSVTAGSAVVTGVGTGWATALLTGGMFGLDSANGNPVPIASIDSNTQLTLAKPWRGTTAATQAYWIMRDTAYGQQTVANATALAQIINELRSVPLSALAGLTPAADKVPYFTSSGAAALADLKEKGRDIINVATTRDLIAKLGPVFGGQPPVPSAAGVGLSDGDFNAITYGGVYTITGNWLNSPFGTAGGDVVAAVLTVIQRYATSFYQYYQRSGQHQVWKRYSNDSGATWTPWLIIELPIVGSVANSGGFPAGAVMERGSNANGEYVRLADGTQICSYTTSITTVVGDWTTLSGGIVFTDKPPRWVYPASFVAPPAADMTGDYYTWSRIASGYNASGCTFNLIREGAQARTYNLFFSAYGRWY